MKERINRINMVMDYLGLTKNNFALSCGIGPSNLNKMLTGEQTITDKTLHKISETFTQINVEWLKKGEGEMVTSRLLSVHGNGNVVQDGQAGGDLTQTNNSESLLKDFIDGLKSQNKLTEKVMSQLDRSMSQTDKAMDVIFEQKNMMERLISIIENK